MKFKTSSKLYGRPVEHILIYSQYVLNLHTFVLLMSIYNTIFAIKLSLCIWQVVWIYSTICTLQRGKCIVTMHFIDFIRIVYFFLRIFLFNLRSYIQLFLFGIHWLLYTHVLLRISLIRDYHIHCRICYLEVDPSPSIIPRYWVTCLLIQSCW